MKNISMSPQYHNVCGLTENEVRTIAKAYLASTHDEVELDKELGTMKQRFNGHKFYPSGYNIDVPSLYDLQLVLTHLRTVSRKAGHVRLDEERNTTNTVSVLDAIKDDRDMNVHDLLQLLSGNLQGHIMTAFGVPEIKGIGRRADITWTLLYYFGVITRGKGEELLIPNLTMRYLVRVFLAVSLPLSV
jgi:Predicted AAA-ATPase